MVYISFFYVLNDVFTLFFCYIVFVHHDLPLDAFKDCSQQNLFVFFHRACHAEFFDMFFRTPDVHETSCVSRNDAYFT